jgi:2-iminobutanoate/2-iminopropanoate deaminase
MILSVPQSAYSQAVKVRGGTLLFLSGVGPADEKGVLAAPGDFPGQVRATWENMRRILAKAGGSLDDIVAMTVYTTERRSLLFVGIGSRTEKRLVTLLKSL